MSTPRPPIDPPVTGRRAPAVASTAWRRAAAAVLALALALPGAAVLTLVFWPLWSWFEARTGIESLGHSGPAGWCFVATYLAVAGLALAWVLRPRQVVKSDEASHFG